MAYCNRLILRFLLIIQEHTYICTPIKATNWHSLSGYSALGNVHTNFSFLLQGFLFSSIGTQQTDGPTGNTHNAT